MNRKIYSNGTSTLFLWVLLFLHLFSELFGSIIPTSPLYIMHDAFSFYKRIHLSRNVNTILSTIFQFLFKSYGKLFSINNQYNSIMQFIVDVRYFSEMNIISSSTIFCILNNNRAHRNKYKTLKSGKKKYKGDVLVCLTDF